MSQRELTTRAKELLEKMATLEKETIDFFNAITCDLEEPEQEEHRGNVYQVTNDYFYAIQKVCNVGTEKELFAHLEKVRD